MDVIAPAVEDCHQRGAVMLCLLVSRMRGPARAASVVSAVGHGQGCQWRDVGEGQENRWPGDGKDGTMQGQRVRKADPRASPRQRKLT
jgi:hypothetical protein